MGFNIVRSGLPFSFKDIISSMAMGPLMVISFLFSMVGRVIPHMEVGIYPITN